MSARSARGLSCQAYDAANDVYFTKEFGKIECLETFTGDELLGLPLKAPNATYEKVYTLPLLTISMGKGKSFGGNRLIIIAYCTLLIIFFYFQRRYRCRDICPF